MAEYQSERVARELEQEIYNLPDGSKLPSERALTKKYGVSRNVIREVLRGFADQGMIEIMAGKGAVVVDKANKMFAKNLERILMHNSTSLKDIVEVRETLETAIFIKNISMAQKEDFNEFWRIYDLLEANKNNPEDYNKYDILFHKTLAKASRNNMYFLLVDALYEITDRQLFLITNFFPSSIESSQEEHRGLIEAIAEGDEDKIKRISHAHFTDILNFSGME